MNIIDLDNLSAEKRKLVSMPNREVIKILEAAKRQLLQENPTPEYLKEKTPKSRIPDFAWEELSKIRDGTKELDEIRWKRYILEYAKIEERPLHLAEKDPKSIYLQLRQTIEENNINSTFAAFIIPILLEYLDNPENAKPILLVGSPGSGKTYTAQILAKFLGLPSHFVYTPEVASYHSLLGDSRTFKAADCGSMFEGIIKTKCLTPVYILDEVDKCPVASVSEKNANIQDQLLTITDPQSRNEVFESFLGFQIDLSRSLIIMTANEITTSVSIPLKDRCHVFFFPDASSETMKTIVEKYAESKLTQRIYSHLTIDTLALYHTIEILFEKGIHSIRKHEEVVNLALRLGLIHYLENNKETVFVSMDFFQEAIDSIFVEKRKIGF